MGFALTVSVSSASISAAFGQILRLRRLAAGLTQEELADQAGLHPTYIGLIERGVRNPTLDVCQQLSGALGVGLNTLISEATSMNGGSK